MNQKVIFAVLLAIMLAVGLDGSITRAARNNDLHAHKLKAASELDYPPFCVVRPDGSADGFSVELLQAVAEKTGMTVDIAVGPWHEIKQQLAEGLIDVLPLVSYSEERDRVYDFTVPYLEMHGTIFVRRGQTEIRGESDLKDKEVLVMRGDTAHEYAVSNNLSTKIILTDTYAEAFSLLSRGRHDAVIGQYLMGQQLIKELGIANVVSLGDAGEKSLKLSGRPLSGFAQKFCFAVPEGERELLNHLNEGLAIVFADGTYGRLYDKWFSPILPTPAVPPAMVIKYLLLTLLPILFLVAIVSVWYLKREVARKTARLQEAQKFNETILSASPDVIYIYDLAERKNIYANQGIERVLGYTASEVKEMGAGVLERLMQPDDFRNYLEEIVPGYTGLQDNEVLEHEYRMKHKAGQWRWLHSKELIFSRQPDGATRQIFGIVADITRHKEAEEKLIKSEEEYRGLFNRMHDGFALHEIICDDAGKPIDYRFLRVNAAFERLTGLKGADLIGRTVLEVLPGTEKHWIDTYGKVALTGEPVIFENFSAELDRHFAVTAYQPAKNQFAAIFQDITPRKQAEKERRELEAQLRQAHKMEAIGTMAGGIAHDFNNILAIVFGNAEMALDDIPAGNPARNNIEDVLVAAGRAKKLVGQILAFSRKEKSELIPIRLQSMINETLKLLRSTSPTTVSIIQEISQDCGAVKADPAQIHQLLMNLFTNAVHGMDEKGTITVRLQEVELNRAELDALPVTAAAMLRGGPGRYVKLSVGDDGIGMDSQIIERIFDPFFTTKTVDKGTGMGLSVVHGIVKSHGGFITVHSAPGQGSTFDVFFPVTATEEVLEFDTAAVARPGTERILLVDDEESLLKMAKRMLEGLGYTVRAESSSMAALDIFRAAPDRFDLVITDQSMPNMSGSELVVEILKTRPAMPIILCTGYSSKVSPENAREQGISKYINKPYSKQSLSEAVREVLDAEVQASGH